MAYSHLYKYGMNTYFKNSCFFGKVNNNWSIVLLFIVTAKLLSEDYDSMELFGYFSVFQTQYYIYLAQNRRFLVGYNPASTLPSVASQVVFF